MSNTTTTKLQPQTTAEIDRIAYLLGLPPRSRSAVIADAVHARLEQLEADQPDRKIDGDTFKQFLGEDTQVVIEADQDGYPRVHRGSLEYRDHLPHVRRLGELDGATVVVEHEEDDDRWRVFLRPTAAPLAGFRLYAGTVPSTPGFRTVETVGKMRAIVDPKLTDAHLSDDKETPEQ